MTKALLIDTETGSVKDPEVVEYGGLEVWLTDTGPRFGDFKMARFSPTRDMEFGAIATHGITPDQLVGLPVFTKEAVDHDCDYLIGHNISFDAKAVGDAKAKQICTLALSRSIRPTLDSHKLMAMIAYLDMDEFKLRFASAHSVETDVMATCFLFIRLCNALRPKDMEDLYQMSEEARIPKISPFSKFKDKPISAVDEGFRNWYRKLPDADPYILKAFDRTPYAR